MDEFDNTVEKLGRGRN